MGGKENKKSNGRAPNLSACYCVAVNSNVANEVMTHELQS